MGRTALEPLLALAYPRHCPLCGTVLEQSAWKGRRVRFQYTGSRASAASSTASACNGARLLRCQHLRSCLLLMQTVCAMLILLCKEETATPGDCARTGRILMAVLIFGAQPARGPRVPPGIRESIRHFACTAPFVSGAPRVKKNRADKYAPFASAALGRILHIPVHPAAVPDPAQVFTGKNRWTSKSALPMSRMLTPAELGLTYPECGCCCLDDVITTGATNSACAKALLEGGAVVV